MCSLEKRSNVYILTLTGDGEHRLNPALIAAIRSALCRVKSEISATNSPGRGAALITTADGKYFSNGYDLVWAYNSSPYTPATTKRNLIHMSAELRRLVSDLISLQIPTIAAVTGHAAAAGMILALSHDYIVMRRDRGFLYMSELDMGVKIPRWFSAVINSKIARLADRRDVLLAAEKVTAGRGMEIGAVDAAYDGAAKTVAGAMRLAEGVTAASVGGGNAYEERRRELMGEVMEAMRFDETVEGEEEPPAKPPILTPMGGRRGAVGVGRL